ncbi:hypothetical protein BC937DRAFT_94257, partial [Endogone sp. FLAS-F59071]
PVLRVATESPPPPLRRHARGTPFPLADTSLPRAGSNNAHQEGFGQALHQGRDTHPDRIVEELHTMQVCRR